MTEFEHELAAIVRGTSDAVVGKSLEGTITSWNDGAEQMYGFTAEEMVGQSITTIIPDDRMGAVPHPEKAQGRCARRHLADGVTDTR
jgi:PAS domain S-box-containing protein